MASVYEVPHDKLIEEATKELQKMPEMAPPSWAAFVKTGISKERPPMQDNWWYIRSAAILRAIYRLGPIGVSKLRTKYGSRKNRGVAPDKTFRASGNIIRKILQKLEIIGFIKQAQVGAHKGRVLTPKGKSFMDKISVKVMKETKMVETKSPTFEEAKEAKEEKKHEHSHESSSSEEKSEKPVKQKKEVKESKPEAPVKEQEVVAEEQ
jgi:small subunit ribosomal protein S19e